MLDLRQFFGGLYPDFWRDLAETQKTPPKFGGVALKSQIFRLIV